MDQIESLQRRADELTRQFKETQAEEMARGVWPLDMKKDFILGAVLHLDPDFALKYEIGDAEYERYLAARKLPTSVHVSGVSEGSIAASAGIMPDDEIVTYDNERIFNGIQLLGVATRSVGITAAVSDPRDMKAL
jgi:membrane-associated protease RseP (regulator of RpoE activity)